MGEGIGDSEPRSKETRVFGLTPKGVPERPLVEALAVLAALYFTAYLPSDPSALGTAISRPVFFVYSIAAALPVIFLVLYTMATTDGLGPFRVASARARSVAGAAALAGAALALMLGLGALFQILGVSNPVWGARERASLAIIPLIVLSAAATGYAEELCFRAYLTRRLGQAGLPRGSAIVVSTLLFALAHGAQGIAGIIAALALGFLFALRFSRAGDLHEVALAHGVYNAVVFVLQLYVLPAHVLY